MATRIFDRSFTEPPRIVTSFLHIDDEDAIRAASSRLLQELPRALASALTRPGHGDTARRPTAT